jgi:hypothetical protein
VLVVVCFGIALAMATEGLAQGLPDPARARALDKCHILLSRTGTKVAVKQLKSLAICTNGIFKCLETKPDDARCLTQARERCEEQLRAHAAAAASLVDTVVRKCGSDSSVDDLLTSAGLDVESLRTECQDRFGIGLTTLADVGNCLARQHACEVERLLAVTTPRAASLLVAANVDPTARAALPCVTDLGGGSEHVSDPRGLGRPLARCQRAVTNIGQKLLDASRKAIGRCLETLFTCGQVKTDPAAAPACQAKAQKRCAVELANLTAASFRPAPALSKACGALPDALLRAPDGLRLAALDGECAALGGGPALTLAAYAECLSRSGRCTVAALSRFESPRADALLAGVGTSLAAALCPALTPIPTATPPAPSATPVGPTGTPPLPSATPTPVLPTATGPTASPTPTCADTYEPSAFPDAPVSLKCNGGSCTDDGYDLLVNATIDVAGETDFYVVDVVDLPGHNFFLTAHLTDIPDDTNYDLYLYRFEGGVPVPLDDSTHNGTGTEVVSFSGSGDDESGQYGIEVRGVSGASCAQYRLEIENPN